MFFVKTFADLNVATLATGQDRELVVWYLARSLDSEGRGAVRLEDLESHAAQIDISSGNLARRLRRGAGTFWTVQRTARGRVVRYRSLAALCEALGVVPRGLPLAVPLDRFKGLGKARATLHATWVHGKTISRTTIENATASTKSTQRRREKCAGVRHTKNLARRPYERGDQVAPGSFVARDRKGVAWVNRQLPNTYHAGSLQSLPCGRLRKVRRMVKATVAEATVALSFRRYFKTGKQATGCKDKQRPYFVDERRTWRGQRLWAWCVS